MRAGGWVTWLAGVVGVLVLLLLVAGGAGGWLLVMAGVWAAMFAVAWAVSRWTGGRPQYLEAWRFEEGEDVIWRDDGADVFVLTTLARPAIVRPMRLHRSRVLVTTRRILVATGELFTGRLRIVYVLVLVPGPAGAEGGVFGGEFSRGYRTLVVKADSVAHGGSGKLAYVALRPDRAVASSFNCAEFRIYTALWESFPGVDS